MWASSTHEAVAAKKMWSWMSTLPALKALLPKAKPSRSFTTVAISVLNGPVSSRSTKERSTDSLSLSWRISSGPAMGILFLFVRFLGA